MFSWLYPQKSVKGDVVLITGGAMGIGRLMALKFAKLGAVVVIWDLHTDLGKCVVDEITNEGGQAMFYQVDVTQKDMVYTTGKQMLEKFGQLDILVNNAGIVGGKRILESDDRMITRTMGVNVLAHFWTIKAFLPTMLERNKGHIVSIASAAGIFGSAGMVDYSASKFASVGLMTSLRQEIETLGRKEIKLTLICPSFIETGMFEGVRAPRGSAPLSPEYVAERVVTAVRRNEWRVILPSAGYFMEAFIVLMPDWLTNFVIHFTGISSVMTHFKQTRPHAILKDDVKKSA